MEEKTMHFNPYYNKQISYDDLDYITDEHVYNHGINITSDKMYKEAHDFNDHMFEMQKKREIYVRDLWKVLIFNCLAFIAIIYFTLCFGSLDFLNTDILSPCYKISNSISFCVLSLNLIFLVFIYFVFIKKQYGLKTAIGILIFAVPMNTVSILLIVFNIILLKPLKKHHDAIKNDAGYPYFIPLELTFFDEAAMEKAKKSVREYRFEDYQIDSDTEMGIPEL